MIVRLASKLTVVAVAALGLSLPGAALSTPSVSAAPQSPCAPTIDMAAAGPYDASPAQSCTDLKQQCMSASVQEGIYGERYVPPDAVAMCMQAYRDCVNSNSDSE